MFTKFILNPFVPTNPKLGFSVSLFEFGRILEQIEIHELFRVHGAPNFSMTVKTKFVKSETSIADWPMS